MISQREIEYQKKWYQRAKIRNAEKHIKKIEQRKIYDKLYYLKNKTRIDIRNKEYNLKNREKIKIYYYNYLDKNKVERKKYYSTYNLNNKQKQYQKSYQSKYPEVGLRSNIRHLIRIGKIFKMNSMEFSYALISWSKTVKKRDKICVICGSTDKLQAHHIIHKKYRPELSLNVNNGITLCSTHHYETHGKFC